MEVQALHNFMHFYTLIFVQFGVLLVSFFAIQLMIRLDADRAGLQTWSYGALISAFGALCLSFFNYLPVELSVIPGVIGIMVGYVCFWHGTNSVIEERQLNSTIIWLISSAILVLIVPTVLIDDYGTGYGLRVIVMSFVLTLFPFLSIKKILSVNKKVSSGSFFLVLAYAGTGLVSFARMVITILDLETKPKPIDLIAFYSYAIFYVVLFLGLIIFIQEKLQQKLLKSVDRDFVTQLENKRAFYFFASKVLANATRKNITTTVAFLKLNNVDELKQFHGDEVTELMLKHFSAIASAEIRLGDTIARYDNNSFAAIFPETDCDSSSIIAQRLCDKIKSIPLILHNGTELTLSCTIGLVSSADQIDIEELIEHAEIAYDKAVEQKKCFSLYLN